MTLIMGIVNVTPDSFSDGGRYLATDDAITHARQLCAQGADILDIGGESTRPGARRVDPSVERDRVVPVIRALRPEGVPISIDTMNAATALAAIESGASIVNDVSGGRADSAMLAAVAQTDAEIVLGHWRGPSDDMYGPAQYTDVAADVARELADRVAAAREAGIAENRIVLDPGIGFGKLPDQNWEVLRSLSALVDTGLRVLVGTSRKKFLTAALDGEVDQARRDLATAVTSALAAEAGAWAVRVHDVAGSRDAVRIAERWRGVRA